MHTAESSVRNTCFELTIPSLLSECRQVVDQFVARARAWGAGNDESLALRHGLHEALVNAILHGNSEDPRKQVRIAYRFDDRNVWVTVEDEGGGFDVCSVPDPTCEPFLSRPGGRGLMLMRHYMSRVEFNATGNRVTMSRTRSR